MSIVNLGIQNKTLIVYITFKHLVYLSWLVFSHELLSFEKVRAKGGIKEMSKGLAINMLLKYSRKDKKWFSNQIETSWGKGHLQSHHHPINSLAI